jgi:hypothetical protein
MNGRYLGRLSHSDPLYAHIEGHIALSLPETRSPRFGGAEGAGGEE